MFLTLMASGSQEKEMERKKLKDELEENKELLKRLKQGKKNG